MARLVGYAYLLPSTTPPPGVHRLVRAGPIEQARRFPRVLDEIRRLGEAERAGALYRAHPEAHPKADLAGFIRRLFPE